MSNCQHLGFLVTARVGRILADEDEGKEDAVPVYYSVDLQVECADCHKNLLFKELPCATDPGGIRLGGNGMSIDRKTAWINADLEDECEPTALEKIVGAMKNQADMKARGEKP